ncbi:MAG: PspC domain-containing protein [Sphaerochaeta sp.]|jgi:phage shock protein C|nr:PspC domain-containing protein [Sphaerochaeta sp.]
MIMAKATTNRWYRSPRGKIFGLCTGLAEWRDLDPNMVRIIVALIVIFTGVFPGAIIYLILSLIIPMQPEGYQAAEAAGQPSDDELKRKYDDLKKKVETMENDMFDKERDWDDRFNTGK